MGLDYSLSDYWRLFRLPEYGTAALTLDCCVEFTRGAITTAMHGDGERARLTQRRLAGDQLDIYDCRGGTRWASQLPNADWRAIGSTFTAAEAGRGGPPD